MALAKAGAIFFVKNAKKWGGGKIGGGMFFECTYNITKSYVVNRLNIV